MKKLFVYVSIFIIQLLLLAGCKDQHFLKSQLYNTLPEEMPWLKYG